MGAAKKPKEELKIPGDSNNLRDKAEIERMKKLLSEKIKDPNLAKKAAFIIAEMLNKKS